MVLSLNVDIKRAILLIFGFIPLSDGQCTFPTLFQNSLWLDTDKGSLTFTDRNVTGWEFSDVNGVTVNDWECYLNSNISSTQFILALKATSTISLFTVSYTAFLCLNMTTVTDYSYYYYQMSIEEARLNYERISMVETASINSTYPTQDDICSSSNGPTTNEYHMVVKNDNVPSTVMSCSEDFYGTYHYSLTNSSGTFCNTGSEVWDVCANTQQMTFNYSQCSTEVAFSASGIVSCLYNTTAGSYGLHTVINTDIELGTDNYRFTCFLSSLNADGSLTVSQSRGSCTRDQTPGAIPVNTAGTETGYTMSLTPHTDGLCPITTTTPTTTTTTTTSTTTTTTPTTTTTTPTTTTTTPTTTTTTPTTTSTTTPTTTTTTSTSTSTSTTTAAPPSSESDNTLVYVAFGVVGLLVLVLLAIVIFCVAKRTCCREKEKPPPTPDVIIEALPHTLSGKKDLPTSIIGAPRATTFIKQEDIPSEVLAFPAAKTTDFLVTLPRRASFAPTAHSHTESFRTHASVTYKPMPEIDSRVSMDKSNKSSIHIEHKGRSKGVTKQATFFRYDIAERKEVSVMDSIIMDENVNFALSYHPRMMEAKQEWDKSNPIHIHIPKTSVPLGLSQDTVTSLNQTLNTTKAKSQDSDKHSDTSVELMHSISQAKSNSETSEDLNASKKHIENVSETSKELNLTKKTNNAETQTVDESTDQADKPHAEPGNKVKVRHDKNTNGLHEKEVEPKPILETNIGRNKAKNNGSVLKSKNKGLQRSATDISTSRKHSSINNNKGLNNANNKSEFNRDRSEISLPKHSRKLVSYRHKTPDSELTSGSANTSGFVRGIQVTPINETTDFSLPVSPVNSGQDMFGDLINMETKNMHRTSTPVLKHSRSMTMTPNLGMNNNVMNDRGLSDIQ